jgi:isopentenyl phosphate kinase
MLTFIKLGGSLITDKRESQRFHADVMRRAADEITRAHAAQPEMKLLIGNGSGSFGHIAAQKYGTTASVQTAAEWRGFAEVATLARRLNSLVVEILSGAGLPVFAVQPSSSARCEDGKLTAMDVSPVATALDHGLIPVVYGDVAFDARRGGTIISTETIFCYLAERLHATRILLLGEVEGVFDSGGQVIPHITPADLPGFEAALGGSGGTDVTGGMATKVRQMVELTERLPALEIRICDGKRAGQIEAVLLGQAAPGTLITCV